MYHSRRLRIIAAAGLLAVALTGCTSLASGLSDVASGLSSSSPTQVTTLADATVAATAVTKAVDVAVKVGAFDRATLIEISALSDGVHTALTDLQRANAAGDALTYASFNAALDAFNAYATAKGVSH